VGGDPTIHLHTIVEAISLFDSLQRTDIDKMKQDQKCVEAVKADYDGYTATIADDDRPVCFYSFIYDNIIYNSFVAFHSNRK
jgi:hypothetical protein